MAYPPPPGASNLSISSHPSLPARPPPSKVSSGFKPAFSKIGSSHAPSPISAPPSTYASAPSYGAPSMSSAAGYGAYPTSYGAAPMSAPGYQPTAQSSYQYPAAPSAYQAPASYNAAPAPSSYAAAAPQIRNPFSMPGAASDYDPEMAAQIAQWQSAYVTKDAGPKDANGKPTAGAAIGTAASSSQYETSKTPGGAADGAVGEKKKKTVLREGGGKKWADDTLVEWDPSHLRLFVGNLAGEVTDESLLKAFSRWKSVQKARVIRDKRTTKSKGYGFVSFSDADDFFQAAKEMNGKYIQSHPVTVSKAKTEIKITNVKERDRNKNYKKKHSDGNGNGSRAQGSYEPSLGPMGGSGVTKPGQKTKNGLRLLG